MRKLLQVVICMLFVDVIPTYARVGEEYVRWVNGEFDIPAKIQDANNISQLQPFLNSKCEFTRMATVRRLGEIQGEKAVGPLLEIFAKEPPTKGLDTFPLVRLEVIRTLGRIGSEEAKSALLDILRSYWEKGPQAETTERMYTDRDFASLVPLLLEELYKWAYNEEVFKTAKEIALSKDARRFNAHPVRIATKSWKLYLKGDTIKKQMNDKEAVKHLLKFQRDIATNGFASASIEQAKVVAAYDIIAGDYNDTVLSSVAKELEGDFAAEMKNKNRKQASLIKGNIDAIRRILQERARKKAEK